MVGSSPQLVIYEWGSNTNMIQGEIAETEGLEILSARAGRIKVAGGDFISTGFGSYKTALGPSRTGNFHNLKCQGIKEITGELMKHPLQEINQELWDTEMVDTHVCVLPSPRDGVIEITGRVGHRRRQQQHHRLRHGAPKQGLGSRS